MMFGWVFCGSLWVGGVSVRVRALCGGSGSVVRVVGVGWMVVVVGEVARGGTDFGVNVWVDFAAEITRQKKKHAKKITPHFMRKCAPGERRQSARDALRVCIHNACVCRRNARPISHFAQELRIIFFWGEGPLSHSWVLC